ncbi:MAG: heme ABC transporter ATP-binding protein [Halobacteria archaeon]
MISLEDVSVEMDGSRILDSVKLGIEEGRMVGLIGPNGAGKSTLLRLVNGYLSATRGTVSVDGRYVSGMSASEISRLVATMPQNTNVTFDFSVRKVVEMGRHPYGRKDSNPDIVDESMRRMEVEEFSERSIHELSGGERQRALLARCLTQDTPYLILDEPTSNLDIRHANRTLEMVRSLVDEEGKTVVAAIHDLNLASRYCDQLVLVSGGSVIVEGKPEEVLTEENVGMAFDVSSVVTQDEVTGATHVVYTSEKV